MSLKEYLKDHFLPILAYLTNVIFIVFCLLIFKLNGYALVLVVTAMLLTGLVILIYNFRKTNMLFSQLNKLLKVIDQKYLVHEMMEVPSNYEGRLLFEYLREINTSMINQIKQYKLTIDDFKQYLELWIHEIKIPLAGARLIIENNKNSMNIDLIDELDRIEGLVEQVLFYVRSEHVENDYTIKECSLEEIVKQAIVGFRKSFIYRKINLDLGNLNYTVCTDTKWMLFVLQQIIANSIKYAPDNNGCIKVYAEALSNQIILSIEDNGIGIATSDISRVFDKGFTGENGRLKYKSTGIGLYICKSLCVKMHHSILIESKLNEKTIVKIVFPINNVINTLK